MNLKNLMRNVIPHVCGCTSFRFILKLRHRIDLFDETNGTNWVTLKTSRLVNNFMWEVNEVFDSINLSA